MLHLVPGVACPPPQHSDADLLNLQLYTVAEVATILSLNDDEVIELAVAKALDHYLIGEVEWVFPQLAVHAYAQLHPSPQEAS